MVARGAQAGRRMYLTAHRVHRGDSTGINAFLHLHRGDDAGIDWDHPDVRFVADERPGAFVLQRTEIQPGNNAVSSYLDVVAHDRTDRVRLLQSITNARFESASRDGWYDGKIGFRFYCSPRHDLAGEFELLRDRITLLLRSRTKIELTRTATPLVIEVSNDDTGVRYELDVASRERVVDQHVVTPASLGVFFENRDALIELWGEDFYRAEIAKIVTGLGEEKLRAMGGVLFRDREGLLSAEATGKVARGSLPGQIDGDWYGPGEDVPSTPPTWDPTGALLVRGDHALLLVPVEFQWHPMSEAAIDTYLHSAEMRRGETWTFLARTPVQRFAVQMAEPLPSADAVAQRYGAEAAARARPDRPTVQVRLRRS
jgi:hypothetical protein